MIQSAINSMIGSFGSIVDRAFKSSDDKIAEGAQTRVKNQINIKKKLKQSRRKVGGR